MSLYSLNELFFQWLHHFSGNEILFVVGLILFIASILESIPIIGMFFPSESLTIFAGILAFKGIIDIRILIIITYLGILIGDIISFYLGQKVGEEFLKKHSKKIKIDEKRYENIKKGLENNLIKVLFLGRTNGFTRWIVPFIAGANGMNLKKFIWANMITASFWAPTFLFGGYFLGKSFEVFGKYIGLGIIIATILSFVLYKIYKHFEKLDILKREDFKYFLLNIFGLYLFSKMLEDVLDLELVTKLDKWIHIHIIELYNDSLNKIMIFITSIFNPFPFTIMVIIIEIYLISKKYFREAWFFGISIVGASILMTIIKNLVQRPRPEHYLIEASGYSFPSGHATLSTAFCFGLYFIFKDRFQFSNSLLFITIFIPLLISFSRVYLNVHYFSDVIAGIGLGLFWVSLIILIFKEMKW